MTIDVFKIIEEETDPLRLKEVLDNCPELAQRPDHIGRTPISVALKSGRTDMAEILIQGNFMSEGDYLKTNRRGETILFIAVAKKHTTLVSSILEKAPSAVNIPNAEGYSPLSIAARNGLRETVPELLAAGACDEPDPDGLDVEHSLVWHDMYMAIDSEQLDELRELTVSHPELAGLVLLLGHEQTSPAERSCEDGKSGLLRIILEHGSPPGVLSLSDWYTGLAVTCTAVGAVEPLKVLMEFGADMNAIDSNGRSILQEACISQNIPMTRFLLKAGADASIVGGDDASPLAILLATWPRFPRDIVSAMLRNGLDLHAQDSTGESIWDCASAEQRELIQELLEELNNV